MVCKEYIIRTERFATNCIQFGKGKRTLILISGLNIRDVKGKMAALGVAYAYRCFAKDYTVYVFDRREKLPEIPCPVLVLGGGNDQVVTLQATLEIAEKLGCEPVIFEEYGHSAYEEAPDFNSRVMSFLRDGA